MNGYSGKLLFVDLTTHSFTVRKLSEDLTEKFIGGYGIAAKILYEMISRNADPLGPENVLGFVTGPLTGTSALFSGRYTVVCKSPVTGGWNDSNSGGFFGPELKKSGYDGVFFKGASVKPVYLWINDGSVEIRDADHLWGKDIIETEKQLKEELGEKKLRAAIIGSAGENLSLIASIMNDEHRAAGRGGCGAVMGSKKLKAIVVRGTGKIEVADPEHLKKINSEILDTIKNGAMSQMTSAFATYGTTLFNYSSAISGDTAVKNWGGSGLADMGEKSAKNLDTATIDAKYRVKKYACSNCPVGCGAIYEYKEGKWPVGMTGRPEYETAGVFGALILNSDPEVIIKCNHLCNIHGFDTISAGGTIAWAIECFENGILTADETDGIKLNWGNGEAVVQAVQAMSDIKTDFGRLLALGSEAAAAKIGKGSEFLQNVRGIELPMHDPRLGPGFARTYAIDPTPARHVKGGLGFMHMMTPDASKYNTEGTGQMDIVSTANAEVLNTSGLCQFGDTVGVENITGKLLNAVTGRKFEQDEKLAAGLRIFSLRYAFNLRHGLKPSDSRLPPRSVGNPPLKEGPLKDITVDHKGLIANFYNAIGWKADGMPVKETLEKLGGLEEIINDLNL
ncbi:MAG: aldehyde ferredoxin oxidoreductase family protein [Spirochaetes bacterium]|nr:aldehyde ferredoxin oxidoreductase family protein [Spirochaetota bacterium]